MDFRLGEEAEEVRAELRAFLEGFMTPEREEQLYRSGTSHDPEFSKAVVEHRWLGAAWSKEDGGHGRDPRVLSPIREEYGFFDAPTYATSVTLMIANTIRRVGTPEQKAEILPKALKGEIVIVLGFTEPESGSDVAAAQTKAMRDGDEWIINGQKMFTTNAHVADYAFLVTRTNPDVAKHKGLTMFLVPLDQPGVEVQPVYTLSGERTNITFYNDVRVPDTLRIGDVDGGWRVMTVALQDEHSGGYGHRMRRLLHDVERWAEDAVDHEGRPRKDDPDVRARIARFAADTEVAILLERRANWMNHEGMVPEAEGPMAKLFSSEAFSRGVQDIVELIGPDALRSYFEPSAPVNGKIEHTLRFSLGTTIYAGTSEVQRNIIAQRGLGLPR
ncbi:MAG: acyl-CoA dehydrogenase family protein [Actinomycetota bacterium]|nr:acyl-CoA dehydrogenase family protein [Actinomycetota bacterium]